jgi:hypothetical protein
MCVVFFSNIYFVVSIVAGIRSVGLLRGRGRRCVMAICVTIISFNFPGGKENEYSQ